MRYAWCNLLLLLAGAGALAQGNLIFSPTKIHFGNVPLSTPSGQVPIYVTNSGAGASAITSMTLVSLVPAGSFTVTANTCGASLGAGATCTVQIQMQGSSTAGSQSGTFQVIADSVTTNLQLLGSVGSKPPPQSGTNPHTQMRWPQNCTASGMFYDSVTNACLPAVIGPMADPSTQVNWPHNCNSQYMVYNQLNNSCFSGAVAIAAGTTNTLPAGAPATVTQTGTFPNYTLNFGIPTGTPGGSLSYPGVITDNNQGLNIAGASTAKLTGTIGNIPQFPTGAGNNGLANFFGNTTYCNGASLPCAGQIPPGYTGTDYLTAPPPFANFGHALSTAAPQSHLDDLSGGLRVETFRDPGINRYDNSQAAHIINLNSYQIQGTSSGTPGALEIYSYFMSPGNNFGTPGVGPNGNWSLGVGTYFKTAAWTPGIHEGWVSASVKSGIGDNTGFYVYHTNYGGVVAGSDEGNHPIAWHGNEASLTYTATIPTGGGGAGATQVKGKCLTDCSVGIYDNGGIGPGDGRYLMDMNAIDSGNFTSQVNPSGGAPAKFTTDHSIPVVSTAFGALNGSCNAGAAPLPQGTGYNNVQCTITLNGGSPGPFVVSTTNPTTNLVCFAGTFHEQALVTNVAGNVLTMNLRHAHATGTWIMQGGPCGQFADLTANDVTTSQVLHYPIDLIGAENSTTYDYAFFWAGSPSATAGNPVAGLGNFNAVQYAATSLTNVGGVVTFTCNSCTSGQNVNSFIGNTIQISGTSTAFDGACTNAQITNATIPALYCTQAASIGLGPQATATLALGTSQYGNSAYKTYKGAEVLDVLDHSVNPPVVFNGNNPNAITTMTLEPNNGAWADGDPIEQPHHYSIKIGVLASSNVFNPMGNVQAMQIGLYGAAMCCGNASAPHNGQAAFDIYNGQPTTYYAGNGGTHTPPGGYTLGWNAGSSLFNWGLDMFVAPGPAGASVLYVGCPSTGCTDPNYYYNVFSGIFNASNHATGNIRYWPYQNEFNFSSNVTFAIPDFQYTRMRDRLDFAALAVPTLSYTQSSTGGNYPSDGSNYYFTVFARNNQGWGLQSNEVHVTMPSTGPNTNSINLSWTRSQGTTFYTPCRGLTSGGELTGPPANGVDTTNWIDRGTSTWSGTCNSVDSSLGGPSNAAYLNLNSPGSTFSTTVKGAAGLAANVALAMPSSGGTLATTPGTQAFGIVTLVAGTQPVSTTAACAPSATCVYKLTLCRANASTGIGVPAIGTITAGTSFVVNSLSPTATVLTTDLSTYCWQIN